MPRDYEIKHAFMNAMRRESGQGVIVTTQEFVRSLERLTGTSACRRLTSGAGEDRNVSRCIDAGRLGEDIQAVQPDRGNLIWDFRHPHRTTLKAA